MLPNAAIIGSSDDFRHRVPVLDKVPNVKQQKCRAMNNAEATSSVLIGDGRDDVSGTAESRRSKHLKCFYCTYYVFLVLHYVFQSRLHRQSRNVELLVPSRTIFSSNHIVSHYT